MIMLEQIRMLIIRAKCRFGVLARDERGDFGIGQIAAIVAGVVIVGVLITVVTGRLGPWIDQVWGWIVDLLNKTGP